MPNTGPQLTLLDRAELLLPTADNNLQDNLVDSNTRQARLLQQQQQNIDFEPNLQLDLGQNSRPQLVMGPLVRCQSARSFPAAQLKLTINGQELSSNRLLENTTLSYADFTEANLITFRLALNDFVQQLPLDRAKSQPNPTTNSTIGSISTPNNASNAISSAKLTSPTQNNNNNNNNENKPTKQQQAYANALVQFNDRNVGMTKEDFRIKSQIENKQSKQTGKLRQNQNQNQQQRDKQTVVATDNNNKKSADRVTSTNKPAKQLNAKSQRPFALGPQAAASELNDAANKIVAETDKKAANENEQETGKLTVDSEQSIVHKPNKSANYHQRPDVVGHSSNSNLLIKRSIDASQTTNLESTPDSSQFLVGQEQRFRLTQQQQQQQSTYSNYIRIKCSSLVGQVRYEMSSELSVPLSVLAGQAIAANGNNRINSQFALDTTTTTSQQQQQRNNANSNQSILQSRLGSQVVLTSGADRVAQASQLQAPTHRSLANPQANNIFNGLDVKSARRQTAASNTNNNATTNYATQQTSTTTTNNNNNNNSQNRGFHLGSTSRLHQVQAADFRLRQQQLQLQQQSAKSGKAHHTNN